MSTSDRESQLRLLFEQYADRVFAYAARQVGSSAGQDVVSDVYLVAWRRIDEVPVDALPWLLVVARNTINNRRRGLARRSRLASDLANLERSSTATGGADEIALERRAVLEALAQLSDVERAAVLLTGWDGLSVAQAAEVAGCSRRAFELRLHRGRSRLRRLLAADNPPPRSERTSTSLELTQEIST